ncbi:hypothetical protein HK102_004324 [Quaeritorhiza haematococci]|nr:hypothetical protein HK102_004324 [Quaeritorhiza haematococci]
MVKYSLLTAVTVALAAHLLFLCSAVPIKSAVSNKETPQSWVDADGTAITSELVRRGRLVNAAQAIEQGSERFANNVKSGSKAAVKSMKTGAIKTGEGIAYGSKKAATWTKETSLKTGQKIAAAAKAIGRWTKEKSKKAGTKICEGAACVKDAVVGGTKKAVNGMRDGWRKTEASMWNGIRNVANKRLDRIRAKQAWSQALRNAPANADDDEDVWTAAAATVGTRRVSMDTIPEAVEAEDDEELVPCPASCTPTFGPQRFNISSTEAIEGQDADAEEEEKNYFPLLPPTTSEATSAAAATAGASDGEEQPREERPSFTETPAWASFCSDEACVRPQSPDPDTSNAGADVEATQPASTAPQSETDGI